MNEKEKFNSENWTGTQEEEIKIIENLIEERKGLLDYNKKRVGELTVDINMLVKRRQELKDKYR